MTEVKQNTVDDFCRFMKQKGMNITLQRKKIAKAFFQLNGHHSLEEFYQIIAQEDPTIGQTTVYRTLKLLREAGLASEIHFSDDITRYEVADPRSHHDHLICIECGKIIEIVNNSIEDIQKKIAKEHGFTLTGHIHNLYGVCTDCQNKQVT